MGLGPQPLFISWTYVLICCEFGNARETQKKPPRWVAAARKKGLERGALFLGGGVALGEFFSGQFAGRVAERGDGTNFLGDLLADAHGRGLALEVAGADGAVAGPDDAFSHNALLSDRFGGFNSEAGESRKGEASESQSGDSGTEHGRLPVFDCCC